MNTKQIKTIATYIRAAEQRTIGQSMPRTTTLNAITQALNLGKTFSDFLNKETQAQAPKDDNCLAIVFPNKEADALPCDQAKIDTLLAAALDAGYTADMSPGAHGFSTLMAWATKEPKTSVADLSETLMTLINTMVEEEEIEAPKGQMSWYADADSTRLMANFMYHDNYQVCSASLTENAWKNRKSLNLTDTEAFFILYSDVEISADYGPTDIELQDIFYEAKFYVDA